MKKIIFILIAVIFASVNAFAETTLSDGSVKGLPQNLIVMDEDGNSPSDGELYIHIEDMIPGELYTKNITIMNARSDKSYNIYMKATPNYTDGNIDLLNETICRLYLDNKLIYEGLVNGDGTPNMQTDGIDLGGVYNTGESRTLRAEFLWDVSGETQNYMNDAYTYDFYGEVSFHWIFYAEVPADDNDDGGSSVVFGGGGGTKKTTETALSNSDDTDNTDVSDDDTNNTDVSENTDDISEDDTDNIDVSTDDSDEDSPSIITEITETIIDNLPFIPEDVKTGYHSELVFYIKIAAAAFAAALVIVIITAFKVKKLNRLKKSCHGKTTN